MQYDFNTNEFGGPQSESRLFDAGLLASDGGVGHAVYAMWLATIDGVKQVGTGSVRLKLRWTERGSELIKEYVSPALDMTDPGSGSVVDTFMLLKKEYVDVGAGEPGPATVFELEFERTGEGGLWEAELHVK